MDSLITNWSYAFLIICKFHWKFLGITQSKKTNLSL
jgi:hypothetical protein